MKLTLEQASAIVDGALRKAREAKAAPLAVAVLDVGGHLIAFKREDGASFLRPQIAAGKAWGALGMGAPSGVIAEVAAQRPHLFTALSDMSEGRVVPVAGGVLIRDAAGELLGAAGVSGDTSERDEAFAIHGVEAAGLQPVSTPSR